MCIRSKLIKDLCTVFNENMTSFFGLSMIKRALEVVSKSDISGKDIPNMHTKTIDYLLNRGTCICGTQLMEGSVAYNNLNNFLYGRKGIKNSDGNVSFQNIFPEQMIHASDQLKFILRLILLLDKEYEPDEAKRIDKAFRYFGTEEDLALFDQYVLGGVEVLYEKLIEGANGPDEYIERLYDFVEEFNDRFNSGISNEDIVNLSRSIEKK